MTTHTSTPSQYVGRFAPSPSGPLHLGSLACAVASYLDAKRHDGRWLVRIEDIDPPREQSGAKDAILTALESHGLHWDDEIRYQSERTEAYLSVLDKLETEKLVYRCNCTRKRLSALGGRYDGHCRRRPPPAGVPSAKRLAVTELPSSYANVRPEILYDDRILGSQREDLTKNGGDFLVHRKDGLFAYQLAVVVDDIDQGITDVVRGSDLLDTTARQIYLHRLLGQQPPSFAHIPVVRDKSGNKLSKQNRAPALDNKKATANLLAALTHLGVPTHHALTKKSVGEILHYAENAFPLLNSASTTL